MSHIRIRTPIPGPRSRELFERRRQAVPRGPFHVTPLFLAGGEGALVEDVDGNRYVDFAGGLGCMNVGYGDPEVHAAVADQAARYMHSCFHVMMNEPYVALAEALNALVPGDFPKKTLLVNSGAEAVENAIKIARAATGRPGIICFENAFHGRTLLAMTLTSKINPYKKAFGPFAPEVYRLPYPYPFRCPGHVADEECPICGPRVVEEAFKKVVEAERVAAVIIEPILGEGGFVVPPPGYFPRLREICDEHGILLIADEIQTGIGRTGRLFACQSMHFVPDLLITAKSLAGGLPLAAITGREEVMESPVVGGLGGTYCGNPLPCAAALVVLKKIQMLCDSGRVQTLGNRLRARLEQLAARHPVIGDVRGMGAMIGMELMWDRNHPAKDAASAIQKYCYEHGVIMITAGTDGNIIRLLMPLVITDEQLDEGLVVIEGALEHVSSKVGSMQ